MPAPATPDAIDGASLDAPAREMLARLVQMIWKVGPTRTPESILQQATRSFRLMFQLDAGAWIRRGIVQLGDPDQAGAILRIPSAFPPEDV